MSETLADVYENVLVREWPWRPWRKRWEREWVAVVDVKPGAVWTIPEGTFTFVSRDTGSEMKVWCGALSHALTDGAHAVLGLEVDGAGVPSDA